MNHTPLYIVSVISITYILLSTFFFFVSVNMRKAAIKKTKFWAIQEFVKIIHIPTFAIIMTTPILFVTLIKTHILAGIMLATLSIVIMFFISFSLINKRSKLCIAIESTKLK